MSWKKKEDFLLIDFRDWPNQFITITEDGKSPVYNSEWITANQAWRWHLLFNFANYDFLPAGKKIFKIEYLHKHTINYSYSWDWYESRIKIDASKTILNENNYIHVWSNGVTYNNNKKGLYYSNDEIFQTPISLNEWYKVVLDIEENKEYLYVNWSDTPRNIVENRYRWATTDTVSCVCWTWVSVIQSIKIWYK
jgi:hypothetical protein